MDIGESDLFFLLGKLNSLAVGKGDLVFVGARDSPTQALLPATFVDRVS